MIDVGGDFPLFLSTLLLMVKGLYTLPGYPLQPLYYVPRPKGFYILIYPRGGVQDNQASALLILSFILILSIHSDF
jgi:hypothetical protein